jgi:hypothetical protein
MTIKPVDYGDIPEIFATARAFIRGEGDGCIVTMSELLDVLSEVVPDELSAAQALDLIEALWTDPHIDQVSGMGIVQFAWNEAGQRSPEEAAGACPF